MNTTESIFPSSFASARSAGLLLRLAAIGLLLALIAGLFLYAAGWFTPHELTPAAIVNTFEKVGGVHPGFRRNHAKGIDVTGYFDSNGQGQAISRSLVFAQGRLPIVGRFAFAGGNPDIADAPQTVRSLAILFRLPDGEEWRTAMINIPVFLVKDPQSFNDFLLASAPDPATGKPKPALMNAFLAGHPETVAAMKVIGSHPFSSGFGDSPYYALNAFLFTRLGGESVPVRWWVAPEQTAPEQTSGPVTTGAIGKNYMFDALIAQVHAKPLRWHLMLTVGQPGDPTADATAPWPPDRKQIDAGTLTIASIESEDMSPTRDIVFDPLVLPDGIAPSDDPILSARSAAYLQSFTRREGEQKTPSAVSPAEAWK
jgi:catalase